MATSTAIAELPKIHLGELLSPRQYTGAELERLREAYYAYENIYRAGDIGFEAEFDKILVLEDEFRSGYECKTCDATGTVKCTDCDEGSSRLNPKIRCKSCLGAKLVTCPECNGKKELIVIADVAKRRPTTGKIVSIGQEVTRYKRGQSVLYPSFCGEVMDLSGVDWEGRERTIVIRFLKERETLCRVHGQMELRRIRKQEFQISG